MKIKMNLLRIFLLLALVVLPTSSVFAQSPGGDILRFGEDYTLPEGETLNGSIAMFGGNIQIEKDATVNGDVVLFGGNLMDDEGVVINGDIAMFGGNITISGEVDGDIVIFGGQVSLASTAVVDGDIATIGGQVSQEPGAQITGNVTNNAPPSIDAPEVTVPPVKPDVTNPEVSVNIRNPFWDFVGAIGQAVVVAGIGMLLTLFLQPQLERVGDAIVRQPVVAGGYGLLVVIVVPVAAVIMAITLILIPVSLLVVLLVMPAAWVFGMVALGQEVGNRFTKAINQSWAPVLSTGFGTFLLMLIVGLIDLIPCVGWLPSFLVMLVGFGGVAMTWFGTRNPPGTMPAPVVVEQIPPTS